MDWDVVNLYGKNEGKEKMKTYSLKLVKGYSRLDPDAERAIENESHFYTTGKARRALKKINLKLGQRLGKSDYLPRIDIVCSDGRVFKWGDL